MPYTPPRYKPSVEKKSHDSRPNSRKRGYDNKWEVARSHYLQHNPLCEDCLKYGRYTQATDVHHTLKAKDNPTLFYDDQYWMPLCHSCHSIRTAAGE